MGKRNYLIEGVSGSGKTTVCHELRRRGFKALNGDRDLAYQGDPETGEPWHGEPTHDRHIWNVTRVREVVADQSEPVTFFCGGSRNHRRFSHLFDAVFILEIDVATLNQRLDGRPDEFGATAQERALILRVHATREDLPAGGFSIDATAPLAEVVDDILRHVGV